MNTHTLLWWVLLQRLCMTRVCSYPLIVQMEEDMERCLRFNIPEDDDAHMVFLAIPGRDDMEGEKAVDLEIWFVDQMAELSSRRSLHDNSLPKRFKTQASEELLEVMDQFLEKTGRSMLGGRSGTRLKLKFDEVSKDKTRQVNYFSPTVLNHLKKTMTSPTKHDLQGYEICFDNTNNQYSNQIVWDLVLVSETTEDSEEAKTGIKKENLTPLEEKLEKSIAAASSVIKEMHYMENREKRMRLTADSINARLRYFSYVSVGVLLVVTYIQVTYLKKYFHKKKLL